MYAKIVKMGHGFGLATFYSNNSVFMIRNIKCGKSMS